MVSVRTTAAASAATVPQDAAMSFMRPPFPLGNTCNAILAGPDGIFNTCSVLTSLAGLYRGVLPNCDLPLFPQVRG